MPEVVRVTTTADIEDFMEPMQNDLIAVFSQLEADILQINESALKDDIHPDQLIEKMLRMIYDGQHI